jgi:hypothetical protein
MALPWDHREATSPTAPKRELPGALNFKIVQRLEQPPKRNQKRRTTLF